MSNVCDVVANMLKKIQKMRKMYFVLPNSRRDTEKTF